MSPQWSRETIADRLADARAAACVGRARERARLAALLRAGGPAVVFVHGAPGIGKSVLVHAEMASIERSSLVLDARRVEPTPSAFLGRVGQLLGKRIDAPAALGDALAERDVSILVLDGYERLGLIDDWVRDVLVPGLPASSSTVLVSRRPPNSAWRSSDWRHLVSEIEVGPMPEVDAAVVVERRLAHADLVSKVLGFGQGHPLALQLAADAFARRADLAVPDGPPPDVVEELVELFVEDLPPQLRELLADVSLLRRVTMPVLAAVLEDAGGSLAVDDAWRQLRELAFVSAVPAGLELDAVVHDVIATDAELRDPGRARRVRRAAGRVALGEADRSPGWESTADLMHLVQNPIIRDAFSPPPGRQRVVDTPRSTDGGAIDDLVAAVDAEAGQALMRLWWEAHPTAFRVVRGDAGTVQGVAVCAPFDVVAPLVGHDPVLAHIASDLERRRLGSSERALVVRRVLTAASGEAPSNESAALVVDLKRLYLELRPSLARVYAIGVDAHSSAAVLEPMGFVPVAGAVSVGSQQVRVWALEFGPLSIDGWLARHIEIESSPGATPRRHDGVAPSGGSAPMPDIVRSLSAREREVLSVLALGLTNRELAERLFISERTANRHLSNIFVKLGVRNRTEAARVAVAAGLG